MDDFVSRQSSKRVKVQPNYAVLDEARDEARMEGDNESVYSIDTDDLDNPNDSDARFVNQNYSSISRRKGAVRL